MKFITDTGRNGVWNARTTADGNCSDWCNVIGGLGLKPSSDTQNDKIDAYFWLKTPGESDGCTPDECKKAGKGIDYSCDTGKKMAICPCRDI